MGRRRARHHRRVLGPADAHLRTGALTILLFSWGVIGGIVNGLGLNRLPRATLVQIIAGFVLVFLGLWLGANEEPSAIFGGGLLVYPGVALVLNPLVVRLVRQSLQNRRTGR